MRPLIIQNRTVYLQIAGLRYKYFYTHNCGLFVLLTKKCLVSCAELSMLENNSYKHSSLVSLITSYKSKISYKAGPCPHNQCDQKIEKNHPISDKKWPNQLPRQKKSQNRNNKAQFESEPNQHQTTFGTLKYLQKTKKELLI